MTVLDKFIKPDLTESEIDDLISRGPEAVRWAILKITAQWNRDKKKLENAKNDSQSSDVNTPSGQIPVYKKPNRVSRRRKKPGAKAGHVGSRRKAPEKIDKEKTHSLEDCPCCGGSLGEAFETRERIVEDIPEVKPVVTKHKIKRYRCKHCGETSEARVAEALPRAAVGNNVLALTAWMHYGLGTTLSQIGSVLDSHLSFKITDGGMVGMWQRLSEIFSEWHSAIAEEARSSAVLHADETGWRVNGKTRWLWSFSNDSLTCYVIDKTRGSEALKRFMGETYDGVLITDFWAAYNSVVSDKRQYCFAHLFRELEKVDGRNDSEEWKGFRKKLTRILRDAIRLDRDGGSGRDLESRLERLRKRLSRICACDSDDPDVARLRKRLRKYEDGILTFVGDKRIHHTNNKAEREIRPAVVMRKVVLQNRSGKGARAQEILMTVYRTLKVRGHDPVKTVASAISTYVKTGKLPPLPKKQPSDG